ncbi:MAG TPA: peptidoglycan bridge formation glycyltransferase FemA/FemB family protein [Bacteroidales bacterium]|nr:GNAT family N-acetyltransferase [Bacteroidales bacterium]HRC88529.1 peptidoglycan bridge formation glycyltransferase FemA/FemB family protein [Bacteroidales bacterium]
MNIFYNDEIPVDAWEEFLEQNSHATPFQSYEFYKLFNSVPGLSAQAIAVCEEHKILSLVVITFQKGPGLKSFFSRRSIIYGGPLIEDAYPDALDLLLKTILTITKNQSIYTETRNLSDYSKHKDIFMKIGFKYIPYLNFHLSTDNPEDLTTKMSNSRMRQIKKAQSSGVSWKEAGSVEEVKVFYNILSGLYKNKIHKPLLPLSFFINFFYSNIGKYLLVWYLNEIIGGIMCPILKERAIYEFYVCGLDDEYKAQYPSVIATWAAIEYASRNKIPVFDFMGAGKPDESYGVRDFKSRFGGELIEFGRFIKICDPFLYKIGESGLNLLSHIGK